MRQYSGTVGRLFCSDFVPETQIQSLKKQARRSQKNFSRSWRFLDISERTSNSNQALQAERDGG